MDDASDNIHEIVKSRDVKRMYTLMRRTMIETILESSCIDDVQRDTLIREVIAATFDCDAFD